MTGLLIWFMDLSVFDMGCSEKLDYFNDPLTFLTDNENSTSKTLHITPFYPKSKTLKVPD